MKNEKKHYAGKQIYDGGSHLPRQLNSLNKIYSILLYDDDKESLYSLYHIYIYILCSFIESLLRRTYDSVLINKWNENIHTQHRHLIRIAQEKLNSLAWDSLKRDVETYLSCSFPHNISESKEMKAINMMFNLRNRLIHGNNFEKTFYANEDNKINFEVSGNANIIYSYFIEQELITQDKIEFLNHFELNSQIIKHFLNCTNTFTKNYCNFIKSIINFDFNSIYKDIEVPISKFQPIEKEL